MFDIRLIAQVPSEFDVGAPTVYGEIQIGTFVEGFDASVWEWTPEQYRRQWQQAAQKLIAGEQKSAFVTSFVSPSHAEYFVWWPCYRSGETVFIQNQCRFYDQLSAAFAVDALYDYVDDRKIISEDAGVPISEWELPLEWIRDFVNRSRVD